MWTFPTHLYICKMPSTCGYRSNLIYFLKILHIYSHPLKISYTEVHIKRFGKFFVQCLFFSLFFTSLHLSFPFLSSDSINCEFNDFITWFCDSKNFLFIAFVQNSIELCFQVSSDSIYSLCPIDFKLSSEFVYLQIHFTNLSSIH